MRVRVRVNVCVYVCNCMYMCVVMYAWAMYINKLIINVCIVVLALVSPLLSVKNAWCLQLLSTNRVSHLGLA